MTYAISHKNIHGSSHGIRELTPLTLALIFPIAPGGALVSIVILLWLSLKRRTPEAILGAVLLTVANPGLFNVGFMSLGRWLVLLIAIAVVLPALNLRGESKSASFFLISLGIFILWSSLSISSVPSLSLLKGLLFITALWTFLNTRNIDWKGFSFTFDRFIPIYVLLTLPFLFIPSIGFLRNGMGFQGLTNQPQMLGILLSMFGVWIFTRVWERNLSVRPTTAWITLVSILIMLVESQSRTALGAFIAGAALVWLIRLFKSGAWFRSTVLAVMVIVGAGVVWTQTTIIQDTIFKERFGGVREGLDDSLAGRTSLADLSLANFYAAPIHGIGLGVPSTDYEELVREPIFGFPISSTAEKGVWVTATLEELGVVGFLLFISFLLSIAWQAVKMKRQIALAFLVAMLVAALGENTLFALGAVGAVQWLLFFSLLYTERAVQTNY